MNRQTINKFYLSVVLPDISIFIEQKKKRRRKEQKRDIYMYDRCCIVSQ